MQKLHTLSFSPYMDLCCRALLERLETASDRIAVSLVQFQRLLSDLTSKAPATSGSAELDNIHQVTHDMEQLKIQSTDVLYKNCECSYYRERATANPYL